MKEEYTDSAFKEGGGISTVCGAFNKRINFLILENLMSSSFEALNEYELSPKFKKHRYCLAEDKNTWEGYPNDSLRAMFM